MGGFEKTLGLFSPLKQLIQSQTTKKALSPQQWRQLIDPTNKAREVKIEGMSFPVTPDEYKFSGLQKILEGDQDMAFTPTSLLDMISHDKKFASAAKSHEMQAPINEEGILGDIVNEFRGEIDPPRHERYSIGVVDPDNLPYSDYRELLTMHNQTVDNPVISAQNMFETPAVHWEEPNVLAHSRANRRPSIGPEGSAPTRNVEEIQSDWHQTGSQEGYVPHDLEPVIYPTEIDVKVINKDSYPTTVFTGPDGKVIHTVDGEPPADIDKYKDSLAHRLYSEQQGKYEGLPPEGPMRKQWLPMQLKRELAQAIEDGDQYLTWTTGDTQSKRWGDSAAGAVSRTYDTDIPKEIAKIARKYGADPKDVISTRQVETGKGRWFEGPEVMSPQLKSYYNDWLMNIWNDPSASPVSGNMDKVYKAFTKYMMDKHPETIKKVEGMMSSQLLGEPTDRVMGQLGWQFDSVDGPDYYRRAFEDTYKPILDRFQGKGLGMYDSFMEELMDATPLSVLNASTDLPRTVRNILVKPKFKYGPQTETVHSLKITPEMADRYNRLKEKTGAGFSMYKVAPFAPVGPMMSVISSEEE